MANEIKTIINQVISNAKNDSNPKNVNKDLYTYFLSEPRPFDAKHRRDTSDEYELAWAAVVKQIEAVKKFKIKLPLPTDKGKLQKVINSVASIYSLVGSPVTNQFIEVMKNQRGQNTEPSDAAIHRIAIEATRSLIANIIPNAGLGGIGVRVERRFFYNDVMSKVYHHDDKVSAFMNIVQTKIFNAELYVNQRDSNISDFIQVATEQAKVLATVGKQTYIEQLVGIQAKHPAFLQHLQKKVGDDLNSNDKLASKAARDLGPVINTAIKKAAYAEVRSLIKSVSPENREKYGRHIKDTVNNIRKGYSENNNLMGLREACDLARKTMPAIVKCIDVGGQQPTRLGIALKTAFKSGDYRNIERNVRSIIAGGLDPMIKQRNELSQKARDMDIADPKRSAIVAEFRKYSATVEALRQARNDISDTIFKRMRRVAAVNNKRDVVDMLDGAKGIINQFNQLSDNGYNGFREVRKELEAILYANDATPESIALNLVNRLDKFANVELPAAYANVPYNSEQHAALSNFDYYKINYFIDNTHNQFMTAWDDAKQERNRNSFVSPPIKNEEQIAKTVDTLLPFAKNKTLDSPLLMVGLKLKLMLQNNDGKNIEYKTYQLLVNEIERIIPLRRLHHSGSLKFSEYNEAIKNLAEARNLIADTLYNKMLDQAKSKNDVNMMNMLGNTKAFVAKIKILEADGGGAEFRKIKIALEAILYNPDLNPSEKSLKLTNELTNFVKITLPNLVINDNLVLNNELAEKINRQAKSILNNLTTDYSAAWKNDGIESQRSMPKYVEPSFADFNMPGALIRNMFPVISSLEDSDSLKVKHFAQALKTFIHENEKDPNLDKKILAMLVDQVEPLKQLRESQDRFSGEWFSYARSLNTISSCRDALQANIFASMLEKAKSTSPNDVKMLEGVNSIMMHMISHEDQKDVKAARKMLEGIVYDPNSSPEMIAIKLCVAIKNMSLPNTIQSKMDEYATATAKNYAKIWESGDFRKQYQDSQASNRAYVRAEPQPTRMEIENMPEKHQAVTLPTPKSTETDKMPEEPQIESPSPRRP